MTEPKTIVDYGKRCLLCRNDAAESRVLCWKHVDEIRDMVNLLNRGNADVPPSIPVLYGMLDAMPASSGLVERRAPGFESSPPGSLHVMAMRDGRSLPAEHDDVRSVLGTLLRIVESVGAPVEDTYRAAWSGGSGVNGLCGWLHGHLDILVRLPWADELYRDLRDLRDQLRAVFGDRPPRPIGHCTNVISVHGDAPGTYSQVRCGYPLYAPPPCANTWGMASRPPWIKCGRCRFVYDGLAQVELALAERERA